MTDKAQDCPGPASRRCQEAGPGRHCFWSRLVAKGYSNRFRELVRPSGTPAADPSSMFLEFV